ncbi:MAG TPA: CinA family nicotinamide mononucleotide deamidase-related protein, partial [Longimicrobiaceae bacterium]|nr:CinA family nicotinamide mononucleotide deamidase-related protein [Longimicrobiaceae bacterium]
MTAAVLAIGDELVSGRTIDTNSGFLAQALRAAGVEITGFFTVPDDEDAIVAALTRALADADLVVSSGGLGPTADDLTTACVARLAGVELELDEGSLAEIEERFRSRGLEMPPNNRKQALFPTGSRILPNPDGTAPGFIREIPRVAGIGFVACLPGVPREMRRITEESLVPWVAGQAGGMYLASRVFSTVGLSESRLDELLAGVVETAEARVSFRAAFPRLQIRLSLATATVEEGEHRLERLEQRVRERLGDHLYAVGDVGLEETVGALLASRSLTLGVAESCTGGLIGHRLTEVPGSSAYFSGGIVAYSNELKVALLGVSRATLDAHGAVSEPAALEMARGVRRATGA